MTPHLAFRLLGMAKDCGIEKNETHCNSVAMGGRQEMGKPSKGYKVTVVTWDKFSDPTY